MGTSSVGGLVGYNEFSNSIITNSYSTGSVSGTLNVGGLLGSNYSGTVSNSYSTGAVSGTSSVGGLLGTSNSATVTNSFWNKTINSNASLDNGLGTGLTTSQMQSISHFSSWNFVNNWSMTQGSSYPSTNFGIVGE
jgi:hypothetical protein